MPGNGVEHTGGDQSHQFGSCHRGPTGDGIEDNPGPDPPGIDEIAGDLYPAADLKTERPYRLTPDFAGDGPGQVGFGRGQPEVVRNEWRSGPDGGGAGGGMGLPWALVRLEREPCLSPQFRQRTLRPVQEAGEGESTAGPSSEAVAVLHGTGQLARREG